MSFIHDSIKIKYVELGYLPNYPYHMISDEEMFDAFILGDSYRFFDDMYPAPEDANLRNKWALLRDEIVTVIQSGQEIPDWIYSYMLGRVISPKSNVQDIHDMLVLMNLDNVEDAFTTEVYDTCYELSKKSILLSQSDEYSRTAPSIFGEPDVIKRLRVMSIDVSKGGV